MATYPAGLPSFSAVANGVTKLVAALFNSPNAEIVAIATELGTDVAGSVGDLKTRLAVSLADDGTFKGIKIVSWTGNGADNRDIAHGLGVAPKWIMLFSYNAGETVVPIFWVYGMTAGNSVNAGSTILTDAVKSVDATNIRVGTGTANTNNYDYVAVCGVST